MLMMSSRGIFLHQQRGSFLLQALLAMGLMFAFIPFLSRQMARRNTDSRMYATTHQVETAQTAARIFIRENAKNLMYNTTVVSGDDFVDLLEPYGLPLGYVPRTALGQNISLVIHKTPMAVSAYLELLGGDLSEVERAELARRIGFYATYTDVGVNIGIELQDVYSDIVRRDEPDIDNSGFLTDLDMGRFVLNNVGNLFGVRGEFDTAQFTTLSITGLESGRKVRNKIEDISAEKAVFQSATGEAALSLNRGTLFVDSANFRTMSMFGDTGNIEANDVSIYDMSMTAGRTSFTGGASWTVHGNLMSDNVSFSVERLDISSYLSATRGQDVYIDEETLDYSTKSGIETGVIYTSNITLRDQTSTALNQGASGAVILDIRPAGTSMLPDALVAGINNDVFSIIEDAKSDDKKTIACKKIIEEFEGVYNKQSLSQYLICQYLFWQNLEKRIDIKKCLMAGGSDCVK